MISIAIGISASDDEHVDQVVVYTSHPTIVLSPDQARHIATQLLLSIEHIEKDDNDQL